MEHNFGDCSRFTQSNFGQKIVIMLDGGARNKDYVQRSFQTPVIGVNIPPSRISSTSISVRKINQKSPGKDNIIRKQETISGNHTTHIQKSTHRVELISSRLKRQRQQQQQQQQQQLQQQQQQQLQQQQQQQLQQQQQQQQLQQQQQQQLQQQQQQQLQQQQQQQQLQQQQQQQLQQQRRRQKQQKLQQRRRQKQQQLQQQQQQQQLTTSRPKLRIFNQSHSEVDDDESYSDDDSDSEKVDLVFLKLVKKMLRNYVKEAPSRKLSSGEYTWSEVLPSIREMYHPMFKKYLLDREIQASSAVIIKCLKDLHVSRRDIWLKKQRKLRELEEEEQMENAKAQAQLPGSDDYIEFIPRVVIYN